MISDTAPALLVADIGGTNTRVALTKGTTIRQDTVARFRNAQHPNLEEVLSVYVSAHPQENIEGACVAVAGPVRDGTAELTNLDWKIDHQTVAKPTGARAVAVLNDLAAQGHALDRIDPGRMRKVMPGSPEQKTSERLVIGVGTGFNCAPVHETEYGRLVAPSEAGHANLPIRTEDDLELLKYVEAAHGFPAIEDVLSGRGLERVYTWQSERAGQKAVKSASDIVTDCASGSDPVATKAVGVAVRMLGTVAGNLSLIHLPFGGVFLVGGVARALAPYFDQGFETAFKDKGRFKEFMADFPVWVIEDDFAALLGCAAFMEGRITRKSWAL
ncbi:MAG: glucokinase [Pseudomonadota bacterium]